MSNWRDFLYFLSENYPQKALPANERYANGNITHYTPIFRPFKDSRIEVKGKRKAWNYTKPIITYETFSETGDTIYTELPSYRFLTKPKERKASSKDLDKSEYEILKRRFNEAVKQVQSDNFKNTFLKI